LANLLALSTSFLKLIVQVIESGLTVIEGHARFRTGNSFELRKKQRKKKIFRFFKIVSNNMYQNFIKQPKKLYNYLFFKKFIKIKKSEN
jgi:hypothetical protein